MKNILNELNRYSSFLITSHINPDGDSLGSEIAMAMILKKMNKEVMILGGSDVPSLYEFLPGLNLINNINNRPLINASVAVVLDCGTIERAYGKINSTKHQDKNHNCHHPAFYHDIFFHDCTSGRILSNKASSTGQIFSLVHSRHIIH